MLETIGKHRQLREQLDHSTSKVKICRPYLDFDKNFDYILLVLFAGKNMQFEVVEGQVLSGLDQWTPLIENPSEARGFRSSEVCLGVWFIRLPIGAGGELDQVIVIARGVCGEKDFDKTEILEGSNSAVVFAAELYKEWQEDFKRYQATRSQRL